MWALQFELDPLIRTEACHSILLLIKDKDDQELIDILHERFLIEKEPLVKKEVKHALDFFGYDPQRDIPIVAKIKADVMKFNDKNVIIRKILNNEKQLSFQEDKSRFLWNQNDTESCVLRPTTSQVYIISESIKERRNAKKKRNRARNLRGNQTRYSKNYSVLKSKPKERIKRNLSERLKPFIEPIKSETTTKAESYLGKSTETGKITLNASLHESNSNFLSKLIYEQ